MDFGRHTLLQAWLDYLGKDQRGTEIEQLRNLFGRFGYGVKTFRNFGLKTLANGNRYMSTSSQPHSKPTRSTTQISTEDTRMEYLSQLSIPPENLRAYKILYSMENAIRMLIVECLEELAGTRWYRHRLPGDILDSYQKAQIEVRKIKWTSLVPHHPIYYIDFPALRKIIEQKKNWDEAFKPIFDRKDVFSASWSSVEPIRNNVAHNRCISDADIVSLTATFTFLRSAIGETRFNELAAQSKTIPDIVSRITTLRMEGEQALGLCKCAERLKCLPNWNIISPSWWFDDSFIGRDLSPIRTYFGTLNEYMSLPRRRGEGHKIEKWIEQKGIDKLFSHSDNLLAELERERF